MNAREALDALRQHGTSQRAFDAQAEAITVLANLVDVAGRASGGFIGAWRAALDAALAGEPWPPTTLRAATVACRSTTVPCGFASCEVHYGRDR